MTALLRAERGHRGSAVPGGPPHPPAGHPWPRIGDAAASRAGSSAEAPRPHRMYPMIVTGDGRMVDIAGRKHARGELVHLRLSLAATLARLGLVEPIGPPGDVLDVELAALLQVVVPPEPRRG